MINMMNVFLQNKIHSDKNICKPYQRGTTANTHSYN